MKRLVSAILGGLVLAPVVCAFPAAPPRTVASAAMQSAQVGRLSGVVLSSDTRRAVRGATVSAVAVASRSEDATPDLIVGAITDDEGGFVLDGLAPGRYRLRATKSGHVDAEYGAPSADQAGTLVAVAAGQSIEGLVITLSRGGVITGTVVDPEGEAVEGVAVTARTSILPTQAADTAKTDASGRYRIYGLPPGDYFVVALPPLQSEPGAVEVLSTEEVDAALRRLEGWAGRLGAPSRPPDSNEPNTDRSRMMSPVGQSLAEVYYPSTTSASEAVRIKVSEGRTANANITLVFSGTTQIGGMVIGQDGLPAEGASVAMAPVAPGAGAIPVVKASSRADGSFLIVNVAPGRYTITARQTSLTVAAAAAKPAQFFPDRPRRTLWAVADASVGPSGLSGVTLALKPSTILSGVLVFDTYSGGPRPPWDAVRVRLVDMDTRRTLTGASPGDGTFEVGGIVPGEYALEATIAGHPRWWLRSAILGGKEVLDRVPNLTPSTEDINDLVLTFSDQWTECGGMLLDATGAPASGQGVLLFAADRDFWYSGTRRLAWAKPDTSGQFMIRGLPAGDYLIRPLSEDDSRNLSRLSFETLAKGAVAVRLVEGKPVVQTLRLPR